MKQKTNYLLDLARHGLASKNQEITDAANSVKSLCVYYLSEWFIDLEEEKAMVPFIQKLEKYVESPTEYPQDMVEEAVVEELNEPEPPTTA